MEIYSAFDDFIEHELPKIVEHKPRSITSTYKRQSREKIKKIEKPQIITQRLPIFDDGISYDQVYTITAGMIHLVVELQMQEEETLMEIVWNIDPVKFESIPFHALAVEQIPKLLYPVNISNTDMKTSTVVWLRLFGQPQDAPARQYDLSDNAQYHQYEDILTNSPHHIERIRFNIHQKDERKRAYSVVFQRAASPDELDATASLIIPVKKSIRVNEELVELILKSSREGAEEMHLDEFVPIITSEILAISQNSNFLPPLV